MRPYWDNGVATLYHVDARHIPLPDASVHSVVTSPPYWGLRDYGLGEGQGIGIESTLGEHIENLIQVFREVRRVLRDDGTIWVNYGDAYANQTSGLGEWAASGTPVKGVTAARPNTGLPPKNLIGLPWRVVFALQADGWILRSPIVWHKPNPMPESVRDRPTTAYEMIFMLAKSNVPTYWTHRDLPGVRSEPPPDYRWIDALDGVEYETNPESYSDEMIRCPDCGGEGEIVEEAGQVSMFDGIPELRSDCGRCGDCGRCEIEHVGSIHRWRRINLWRSHDYCYDAEAISETLTGGAHARRKDGLRIPLKGHDPNDRRSEGWIETYTPSAANARNVWVIPTQSRSDAHFATFPDEIPRRCILAATSEHGVCSECGAPWERVTEREKGESARTAQGKAITSPRNEGSTWNENSGRGFMPVEVQTTGWRPTCACDASTESATVLDPFVGSGTTLAVAQSLGRRGVGLDLNDEYLGIATRRIGQVSMRPS